MSTPATIQQLDKAVRDTIEKELSFDEDFLKKLMLFIQVICDNSTTEIGELRIYDLHMAVLIALRM